MKMPAKVKIGKRGGGKAPKRLPARTMGDIPPPSAVPIGAPPGPLPPVGGAGAAGIPPGGPAATLKAAMLAKLLAGGGGGTGGGGMGGGPYG
jgi:hypothetical protein